MDSPVRKMLKKNDYNRHKLLRKIKRQRKAKLELESHAAEKLLRRKLKMPKFEDGKDYYTAYVDDINQTRVNPKTWWCSGIRLEWKSYNKRRRISIA